MDYEVKKNPCVEINFEMSGEELKTIKINIIDSFVWVLDNITKCS